MSKVSMGVWYLVIFRAVGAKWPGQIVATVTWKPIGFDAFRTGFIDILTFYFAENIPFPAFLNANSYPHTVVISSDFTYVRPASVRRAAVLPIEPPKGGSVGVWWN